MYDAVKVSFVYPNVNVVGFAVALEILPVAPLFNDHIFEFNGLIAVTGDPVTLPPFAFNDIEYVVPAVDVFCAGALILLVEFHNPEYELPPGFTVTLY